MQTYVVFYAKDREEAADFAELTSMMKMPEGYLVKGSLTARREDIEHILPRSIEREGNFMQPYVYHGDIMEVEEDGGYRFMPLNEMSLDDEAKETGHIYKDVYYGRMSADGYLDCTPWLWSKTEDDVLDELEELYGDDEPPFKLIEGGKA